MKIDTFFSGISQPSYFLWLERVRPTGRTALRFMTCTVTCVSLLVMGSDGPWFPWPNLAGACVLALIVCICNLMERKTEN